MPDEVIAFFAYGTLKRGEVRERHWPCRPIAVLRGWTVGSLWEVADYPGLKLEGETRVLGELWLFDAKQEERLLKVLDEVEGYPSLYTRDVVECETLDGQPITATAYIYNRPILPTHPKVPADAQGMIHWTSQTQRFS
ncbi:gamma-glutamylcyclotransferase [bacterium]|nr:gamma-glutamylcyclotransferase [bacterium]